MNLREQHEKIESNSNCMNRQKFQRELQNCNFLDFLEISDVHFSKNLIDVIDLVFNLIENFSVHVKIEKNEKIDENWCVQVKKVGCLTESINGYKDIFFEYILKKNYKWKCEIDKKNEISLES